MTEKKLIFKSAQKTNHNLTTIMTEYATKYNVPLTHSNKHFSQMHTDSWLNSYINPQGYEGIRSRAMQFETLEEAFKVAMEIPQCGGITFEAKKKYTLRRGMQLFQPIRNDGTLHKGKKSCIASWVKIKDKNLSEYIVNGTTSEDFIEDTQPIVEAPPPPYEKKKSKKKKTNFVVRPKKKINMVVKPKTIVIDGINYPPTKTFEGEDAEDYTFQRHQIGEDIIYVNKDMNAIIDINAEEDTRYKFSTTGKDWVIVKITEPYDF
jgi:hypothetical protein